MRIGISVRSLSLPPTGRSAICTLLPALVLGIISQPSLRCQDRLRVWMVFTEPRVAVSPADTLGVFDGFVEEWANHGIELGHLRGPAARTPGFVGQLVGQRKILNEMARFRAAQPGFPVVEVHFFDWIPYGERVRTHPKDEQPDLIHVPTTWCSSMADEFKILGPIPRGIDEALRSQYEPSVTEPCMVYGKPPLHALPFLIDLRFLYFWRSDLPNLQRELQKSNNARDTFWRNLRSARAAPGKFPFAIPTAREWELMHHLALLVWGHGGQLVETHGRHSTPAFVEPGLRGAIFLRNLVKEGLLDLPSVTREDLEQKFLEKQVSSIISGPWLMEQIQKKYPEQPWNELVGVALPALYGSPETAVTFQGGTMLGVTGARRSLQVAALKLARHLTQSADTLTWTSAEGLVPAAPGLRGGPEGVVVHWSPASSDRHCSTYFQCLAEGSSDPAVLQVVQQAIKVGRGYPAIPKWWDIEVKTSPRLIFHFFQELAELKSEDALKADLQAIASEWEQILGDQQQPTSALPWVGMCFVAAAFVTWLWNIRRTRERLNSITAKTPSAPLQPAPAVSMPLGQEVTARITASQGFSIPALEEAIRISGYSIEEVAARLDLDEKNLRKILHGEVKKPTAKTRRKLEAFIEDPRNCRFKRDVT